MSGVPTAEYVPIRVFVVDAEGECIFGEMSSAVSHGLDILKDDGVPIDDRWLPMLLETERQGKDPVAFARHVVKLRGALR